jgi:hypothetical protein
MSRTHLETKPSSREVADHRISAGEHEHPAGAKGHGGAKAFWLHYVQMVLAMLVGMAVLGIPFRAILKVQGYSWEDAVTQLTAIVCVVMTFNMAVAMVAWMRFRGHSWRASAEMTGSMCLATAVTLALFWASMISADMTIGMMHVLMLPAMLGAMLDRRLEYSRHATHRRSRELPGGHEAA